MNPVFQSWRFNHPDFDPGASGLALSPGGALARVEGADAVRQSILLLLSTRPGERLRRPGYGCDLDQLVFMPNDATTHGLAIHYIRQALERWEPRVRILGLDACACAEEANRMEITLDYALADSPLREQLVLRLNLAEPGP